MQYAQLLHDASEIRYTESDPHQQAQNTTPAGDAGIVTLEVPIQKPGVLVPVIELFLADNLFRRNNAERPGAMPSLRAVLRGSTRVAQFDPSRR
uniref:CAZy families GH29 protein n=1 Tax=uncultured Thermobaculum sp. TaxID=683411 RepID=A0A060BZX9_9CHLR|nr:CAZy families GH29 protein [uncultured Thermobaculum sp.]